jgi:UDP-N-acetyl-D-mannosaminuronic acid dehydrogenase
MDPIDICVVGLGYIGLPTASLLANRGHQVHGVDVNQEVVDSINSGENHFQEPDLDVLVRSAVNSGKLKASTRPAEADIFIIAVPTPFTENRDADLSYIKSAAAAVAPCLKEGSLIVLESTSPVGTTNKLADVLLTERPDLVKNGVPSIHVAHCPERVLPGRILIELVENDRIVGGINTESTERAVAFYETFVRGSVLSTDAKTAELAKLTENSYRDVNIAFANELSMISGRLGVNVWDLINLANRHPRVNILRPGAGVGGHCIAVDPWFIVSSAPEEAQLIRTAREVNDSKMEWSLSRVQERAKRFRDPVIACLGLTYKPDVDDLRESPALAIAKRLTAESTGTVLCVDPNVREIDGLQLATLEQALNEADIIVTLVSHRQFKRLDPEFLKDRVFIDLCGALT